MTRFLMGTLLISALSLFALGCENRGREGTQDKGTGMETGTESTTPQGEMDRTTPPNGTGVTPRDTDSGISVPPRDTGGTSGTSGTGTGAGQTGTGTTEDTTTGTPNE